MIKFVSDLGQVHGILRVRLLQFPPPIKLSVESGIKHHTPPKSEHVHPLDSRWAVLIIMFTLCCSCLLYIFIFLSNRYITSTYTMNTMTNKWKPKLPVIQIHPHILYTWVSPLSRATWYELWDLQYVRKSFHIQDI